ncbi:accessory Sec system protein Asp1 [Staphylococcus sp. IVB6246]|uniref:accessory Sec system protein Asp1 n=1 Tax=Staphylococcus sp. IVB6246 TaxID=2989772 RepID=UPI0021D0904D|nr:accessory Sec system protein Asp1 [Staphylococcus sp. IVB6246]
MDDQLQTLDPHASWLVDTLENEQLLATYQATHQLTNQLMRITPFDAQTLPNISSQLHETYIGLWIDGLADARLCQILDQLMDYMHRDTALRLTLLTRRQKYTVPQWLVQKVDSMNTQLQQPNGSSEVMRELMKEDEPTIFVELKSVPFELDVIEALATLRVMIDLSHEPDLFLQISSLSAGLPQINMRATDYVQHRMNGIVLTSDSELPDALDFYLIQLKNWNQSYAYAMKLGKQYASDKIIAQLDVLIEGESNGA